MSQNEYILAIDQGTTSSRAMVFDRQANVISVAQREFAQHYPADGWVEHNPEDIWQSVVAVVKEAIASAEDKGGKVVAIGITNQRETTVVWDRETGQAIYNAIVWQDRRTADVCRRLKQDNLEAVVTEKTGLLLDPYFSATKVAWILDNVDGARDKATKGQLAFGTIDTFLIARLTGQRVHATDPTNASRTNLYNIHSGDWDPQLLQIFGVPEQILPQVLNCADDYGVTDKTLFGCEIPILGVAGDQQAAAIGQGCFDVGAIKSTYGTGCFVLMNTGDQAVQSTSRLLTTIAYQLDGKPCYALEGSIFIAGAAVQWLRDGIGLIDDAKETESMAAGLADNADVYLVPAFTGLGAPHWDPEARGAIFGLTRDTGPAHFVRAALESVCYQTYDLLEAMARDAVAPKTLRVDGGMVANNWLVQYLADTLNVAVDRPKVMETTALGAAYLAGYQAGIYSSLDEIASAWKCESTFLPKMDDNQRQALLSRWHKAVSRVVEAS